MPRLITERYVHLGTRPQVQNTRRRKLSDPDWDQACVVDPGYTGEIYVNLHNIGHAAQEIGPGTKIAQAVLVPIEVCEVLETFTDPAEKKTQRGQGGFGSTGEF